MRSAVANLRAGALVAVVVEHVEPGRRALAVEPLAGASVAASPVLRLRIVASNGATGSGQMMPFSSWLASMMAATSRLGPMP